MQKQPARATSGNRVVPITDAQAHETQIAYRNWAALFDEHGLGAETVEFFQDHIRTFYRRWGRSFSWRSEISPYRVLVSEIMLQQTQTARVENKFAPFIDRFPGFAELAAAPLSDILRCWKGLGYNRRAKYLHDTARHIVSDFGAELPDDPLILQGFPGIGKATAASICVFAFDRPIPFLETNIRTVYIHFFFAGQVMVSDRPLMDLVARTMDRKHPRHWFYALMDYGVMLKKNVGNLNRKSSSYTKQSRFAGSDRELRGRILQVLLDRGQIDINELPGLLSEPAERVVMLVESLGSEGLVKKEKNLLRLP